MSIRIVNLCANLNKEPKAKNEILGKRFDIHEI